MMMMSYSDSLTAIVIGLLISWLLWQGSLRFQLRGRNEPPMLPYLFPFLGHTMSFLMSAHSSFVRGQKYFGNSCSAFTMRIAGRPTYVITNPNHVHEVYKNTTTVAFDPFIDLVMGYVGVSGQGREKLWEARVKDTKLDIPNSIRSWVRVSFQQGGLLETRYQYFLDEVYRCLLESGTIDPRTRTMCQEAVAEDGSVSLVKWAGNVIIISSTDALFGPACVTNHPSLVDSFHTFNHNAWMMLFQWPSILSRVLKVSKGDCLDGLTSYFDLPQHKRPGAVSFITQSESAMREHGLDSRDIAGVIFNLYWALNGNPALLNFWLLADVLYRPELLQQIRSEVAKAFSHGEACSPDMKILMDQCPILNATFYEGIRLHGGATAVRRVREVTTVAGYSLQPGADVMVPYRELLLHQGTWGDDAECFNHERFLHNATLSSSKWFKPFGGGTTYCPGRMLARQVSLLFLATVLHKFDIEVVGGCDSQPFPRMNEAVPTAGILSPHIGQDIRVRISKRSSSLG